MPDLPEKTLRKIIAAQTRIAQAPMDLGEVMDLATELAMDVTDSSGAVIELREGEEMVYRAVAGTASHQLGLRIPLTASLSGLCIRTGERQVCEDSEGDGRVNWEACRLVGLRSMVVVPLRYRNLVAGVLKVLKAETEGFGTAEIHALETIADMIAASMAHATLYQSRVEESEALFIRATVDSLTGLANRAAFHDRLRQALATARRYGEGLGVVVLDMDRLKVINDTLGHAAGDLALKTLAKRLQGACRDSDVVARLGGDEFALVFPRLGEGTHGEDLVQDLARKVAGPLAYKATVLELGASVGLALYPRDGEDPDTLLKAADEAMYRMKRDRRVERQI